MYSKIPIIPCTVRCELQNSNSFFKAMQMIMRRTSSVIIKPDDAVNITSEPHDLRTLVTIPTQ